MRALAIRDGAAASEDALALALLRTGPVDDEQAARLEVLARAVDPAVLGRRSVGMRIDHLVEARCAAAGLESLAERMAAMLDGARQQREALGVGFQLTTVGLVEALARRDIPALPLKGPVLGERLYGTPGARLSADIDLLVAPEQLTAATELVMSKGYTEPPDDPIGPDGLPTLHVEIPAAGGRPPVEIHWRISWYERHFSRELLETSRRDAAFGRVPEPTHELASLLLFYARDGFAGARFLADISAWWNLHGDTIETGAIAAVAQRHPSIAKSLAAAAIAADELIALPLERLWGRAETPAVDRAVKLANPRLRGSQGELSATVGLVDALLAPRGQRTAMVRRQLLPSIAVVRRWPEPSAGEASARQTQLLHPFRQLGRWVAALARTATCATSRRRPWSRSSSARSRGRS